MSTKTTANPLRKTIFMLYFAHIITQFGSYLSFIPVGKALSQHFPVGEAWAILLTAKSLGYLFMPRIYANLAHRFGVAKVVACGQILAGLCIGLTALGYVADFFPLMVLGIFLESCCSSSLEVLFPSFLQRASQRVSELKSFVANKITVEYIAFIFARALGGLLNSHLPFWAFLLFDAITFLIAAILWVRQAQVSVHDTVNLPNVLSFKKYGQYFLRPHLLFQFSKKAFYGILNPAVPVFILGLYQGTDTELGLFYFVAGFGAILGSRLAKRLQASRQACLWLTAGEFLLLFLVVLSPHLYGFLVLIFVSVLLAYASDVMAQTLFMDSEDKSRSHEAAGAFATTMKISMLCGYWIYLLMPEVFTTAPQPWCVAIGLTWVVSSWAFLQRRAPSLEEQV